MPVDTAIQVREIMRTHVTTVLTDDPVLRAIETLEDNRISGAPVVDRRGNLAGFLSIRDIARSEHLKSGRFDEEVRERLLARRMEEFTGGMDDVDEDEVLGDPSDDPVQVAADRVQDWMNPEVIAIAPDATLAEVCKRMVAERIHRVVVVEDGQLIGIVTTFDVVRHIARS